MGLKSTGKNTRPWPSAKSLGKIWGNRGPCESNAYTMRQRQFFVYHLLFKENATYPPCESNVIIGRRARLRAWLPLLAVQVQVLSPALCRARGYGETGPLAHCLLPAAW